MVFITLHLLLAEDDAKHRCDDHADDSRAEDGPRRHGQGENLFEFFI